MTTYENTNLWLTTLAVKPEGEGDSSADPRERLRAAYLGFRDRTQILAAEISKDLPDFTVHDISHIDALWEMTDLVAGSSWHLTPTEAFVLGGAFLIHDLGMGLAAYPEGLDTLRNEQNWRDTLAAVWRTELGRSPTSDELENPPTAVEKSATAEMLRVLHAQRAERLALVSWTTEGEDPYYLIDNPELRREFGPLIGLIAHSHWWPVDKLKDEFSTELGAPYGYPREWTVDPLKLACLLRVADVSHLDARRAPGFLRALRQPEGIAREHWVFQGHLHQPQLSEDRLLYTSGHRFTVEEASAWWLCFDTLQTVDRELRQVDALLADTRRTRLAARSVVGVEDPVRLVRFVRTEGWTPVDARLRVGDVAQLVKRLGGEELYGRDATIPLRELLQNASDAVRARRVFERRPDDWGSIVVRLGSDADGHWLEVEDDGIGMSTVVLTETLLDFGASYWGSSVMRQELPGLLSSKFEPTGKYGIGFFSVFMWGQRVRVVTRHLQAPPGDTSVLEFETGLRSRPVLRQATNEERLLDGGTRVRVWLNETPYEDNGLLRGVVDDDEVWTLPELCAWLAPALDVNLFVEQGAQGRELVVAARDWISLEGKRLLERIQGPGPKSGENPPDKYVTDWAQNLRLLVEGDDSIAGRAFVGQREYRLNYPAGRKARSRAGGRYRFGVVTVGGLRSTEAMGIGGILIGEPVRAARDQAIPKVNQGTLTEWATEQAKLLPRIIKDGDSQAEAASIIRLLGGDTKQLFIARTASRWVTAAHIANRTQPDEVILVQDAAVSNREITLSEAVELEPHVFAVNVGRPAILQTEIYSSYLNWPPEQWLMFGDAWFHGGTLEGAVIEALANAWGTPLRDVLDASNLSTDVEVKIGTADGETISIEYVDIIRNPRRLANQGQ